MSGHFVYPDVPVHSKSPALSFYSVAVTDIPCAPIPDASTELASKEPTLPDLGQHLKPKKTKGHQVDAKEYFLNMYGKKDMFSKQVSAPIPATPTERSETIVDQGENLLRLESSESITSEPPIADAIVSKKSSLGGLFMAVDDAALDDNKEQHSDSASNASTSKVEDMFQSFGSFALESKSTPTSASASGISDFLGFDTFPTSAFPEPALDTNTTIHPTNDLFAGFSDAFSPSASAAAEPVPVGYIARVCVESHEELLCVYKGMPAVMDKFDISCAVGLRLSLNSVQGEAKKSDVDGGVCVTVLTVDSAGSLLDPTPICTSYESVLEESSPSTLKGIKPLRVTLLPSHTSFAIQEQQDTSLMWSDAIVMRCRTIPTYRPEFVRARCTVTRRESTTPAGPSFAAAITIQILLNKNFNMFLEDIHVLASLSPLESFQVKEVKSKPIGSYNSASKVLTWACGSHYPSKQPNLQLEGLVVLGTNPSTLPTAIPVIIKMRTSSSIIPDCHFKVEADGIKMASTEQVATIESVVAEVTYKSKIEYRFL